MGKRKWAKGPDDDPDALQLKSVVIGRPELLFLDEPTAGFDPQARREFHDLVHRLTDLEIGGTWRSTETILVLVAWAIAGMVLAPRVLRRLAQRQSGSQVEAARDQAAQWVR